MVAVAVIVVAVAIAVAVTWEVADILVVAEVTLAESVVATPEVLAAVIPVDSVAATQAALVADIREASAAEVPRLRSRMELVAEVLRDQFRKLPPFITHQRVATRRLVADSKVLVAGKLRGVWLRRFINQEPGTAVLRAAGPDSLVQTGIMLVRRSIIREPLRRSEAAVMLLRIPALASGTSPARQRTRVV